MDISLKKQIESASSILILLPASPLLDEVSAGLSMQLAFSANGKDAPISCPTQMTVEFSRLIGVDKVSTQLGNKNLVITFPNYPADSIERVSYDVESGQFKLSVIPKPGQKAPTKEQVIANYEGISADTIILIGGDKETDFPAIAAPELKEAKMIHIGTKLLETSNQKQTLSFAEQSSSVSELTAKNIKILGYKIDADMATNLLAGIEEGSANFQSPDVTAKTFETFAQLLKYGGLRLKKVQPGEYPQGAIPNQPYTQQQKQLKQVQQQIQQTQPGQGQQKAPQSWVEPKVYTGTSIS